MTAMITAKDNDLIKHAVKLTASVKYRRETGSFIAEGVRLCRDAADSGSVIEFFLYTEQAARKYAADFDKISRVAQKNISVSESVFNKISDRKAPQGVMCIVKALDKQSVSFKINKRGRYAALENIQDPSNMGTILRTAEALGTDGVILSADCCDVYSPKTVRGSMGAVFRVPMIITESFTEYMAQLTRNGFHTYASTPHKADDLHCVDFSQGGIMLIGNEGNGLKQQTIDACFKKVKIPMKGRAESLNAAAAAAILMYKLMESD